MINSQDVRIGDVRIDDAYALESRCLARASVPLTRRFSRL